MKIQEIKTKLLNDELNYKEAFELIKALPKHWHTKEWKENRDKKIGKCCSKCNEESILVIQHTKQPPPFSSIYNSILINLFDSELNNFSGLENELESQKVLKEGCPICKSVSIRQSKNKEYTCTKGHKFTKTIEVFYYDKSRTSNIELAINRIKDFIFNRNYQKIKKENDYFLGKLALLESIKEHELYMSMEHTKTLCRRCAFIEDKCLIDYKKCKE